MFLLLEMSGNIFHILRGYLFCLLFSFSRDMFSSIFTIMSPCFHLISCFLSFMKETVKIEHTGDKIYSRFYLFLPLV